MRKGLRVRVYKSRRFAERPWRTHCRECFDVYYCLNWRDAYLNAVKHYVDHRLREMQ